MEPVLIYTDTKSIADEHATLNNIIPLYQAVYDAVKSVGVTSPTLNEIYQLVQNARRKNERNFAFDYVQGKMVAQAGPMSLNGVTFSASAVAKMVQVPDVSPITAALQTFWGNNAQWHFIGNAKGTRLSLLSLSGDVISAASDADAQITALFNHYTKNDQSAALANELQAVCDGLNVFNTANGGLYVKRIPSHIRDEHGNLISTIPGVAVNADGNFIIGLKFIRKFEQMGTLTFA